MSVLDLLLRYCRRGGGSAPPEGTSLWSFTLADTATMVVAVLTTDTEPIYVDWGDGSGEYIADAAMGEHIYAAGSYVLAIATPERLAGFLGAADNFGGLMDTTYFTALALLSMTDVGLEDLTVPEGTLLSFIGVLNNDLSAATINALLIEVADTGLSNGELYYDGNPGSDWEDRSSDAQYAQMALQDDGWTIDPSADVTELLEISPESTVTVSFKLTTSDDSSYTVYWPDSTSSTAESGASVSKQFTAGTYSICISKASLVTEMISMMDGITINDTLLLSAIPNVEFIEWFGLGTTDIVVGSTNAIDWITVQENALPADVINALVLKLDGSAIEDGNFSFHSQSDGTDFWTERSLAARTALYSLTTKGWTVNPGNPVEFWNDVYCYIPVEISTPIFLHHCETVPTIGSLDDSGVCTCASRVMLSDLSVGAGHFSNCWVQTGGYQGYNYTIPAAKMTNINTNSFFIDFWLYSVSDNYAWVNIRFDGIGSFSNQMRVGNASSDPTKLEIMGRAQNESICSDWPYFPSYTTASVLTHNQFNNIRLVVNFTLLKAFLFVNGTKVDESAIDPTKSWLYPNPVFQSVYLASQSANYSKIDEIVCAYAGPDLPGLDGSNFSVKTAPWVLPT